jgi:hypothetical protein
MWAGSLGTSMGIQGARLPILARILVDFLDASDKASPLFWLLVVGKQARQQFLGYLCFFVVIV